MNAQAPLDAAGRATDPGFPGLRPFDGDEAPAPARRKAELIAGSGPAGWREIIDSFSADPGGGGPLLRTLAWGLTTERLLRWMCLAARLEEIVSERKRQSQALITAERWLREQDDALRYEAYRQGQAENFATPAAMAALATFVSGPSLAPADAPAEPPAPGLGRASATSVLMAAAGSDALTVDGFGRVNKIGLDLARGGDGRSGARDALTGAVG